ncbi:MAG: PDZ domain-containing protein [Chitinophagaceae bacterium]|nr:PDZ domain-containing protein [Chitinophagaceae bacterium]
MANKKLQVWLPLIFSVVMIVGMFLGYGIGGNSGFFKTEKPNSVQQALDVIKRYYVDDINADSLQMGAIEEMMGELDPHSVYFPPVELKAANEDLAGNFEGIGVEFNVFSDTVNIVYVIPNGPSDKAGLLIGDKILKVNDTSITAKDISTDRIKELIRGEGGSEVVLGILRNGQSKAITVIRGTIPVPSVDAFFMIDRSAGYIKLNKFTKTSYEEFMQALESLQKQGLQQLIFDLRGNGGGFMDEAINMADEFLDQDKLIVYTEGANNPKREYRCKRPGLFEKGKLVLLVDEFSASASEVLAGAIQDWDRGTIIGRRTFGKGLVQEQFELKDGSAIRLTIARYYTPIGRSIQRPYDHGKKDYMDEIWQRYSNGEALYADSNKINNGKEYKTNSGKKVYGGGGIMPDVFVPIDTSGYPPVVSRMLLDGSFNNFVYRYYLQHKVQIDAFSSAADYIQRFNHMDDMWDQFVNFIPKDSANLSTLSAEQKDSLQRRLEAYLARFRWRNTGFYQVLNNEDPAVKKALEELRK